MPCGLHRCKLTCFPKHSHKQCTVLVADVFPRCGHTVHRKCFQDIKDLKCQVQVKIRMPLCGHTMDKICSQADYEVSFDGQGWGCRTEGEHSPSDHEVEILKPSGRWAFIFFYRF